jgi:hypothetical protein
MRIVIVLPTLRDGGAERVAANIANFWATHGRSVIIVTFGPPTHRDYSVSLDVTRLSLNLGEASTGIAKAIGANTKRLLKLRKTLATYSPDVVVGFLPSANVLVALACLGTRYRSIGCERLHPPRDPLGRPWELARSLTYPFLSAIMAQTQDTAEWLAKHVNARRIAVIPNPIKWPIPATARPWPRQPLAGRTAKSSLV